MPTLSARGSLPSCCLFCAFFCPLVCGLSFCISLSVPFDPCLLPSPSQPCVPPSPVYLSPQPSHIPINLFWDYFPLLYVIYQCSGALCQGDKYVYKCLHSKLYLSTPLSLLVLCPLPVLDPCVSPLQILIISSLPLVN